MESVEERMVLPALPSPRARFGPSIFWRLLVFTLRDFFRSPWVFFNLLALVGVQTLFYQYKSGAGHFFSVEYAVTAVLAAITSAVIFARANRGESYPILARPVSRVAFTGALMLAAWLVAIGGHFLLSLVEGIRFGPLLNPGDAAGNWRTPETYLQGNLPILVAAAVAIALVALLTAFVSTSGVRLVVLGTLALLVMSFDSRNFPIEAVRPLLDRVPPVLAPMAGALKYSTEYPPTPLAVLSLGILAAYALILIMLVLWLAATHELILD